MFSLFLKPFFGLVTVGGLGTGGYFLYKHVHSKKFEKENEESLETTDILEDELKDSISTDPNSIFHGQETTFSSTTRNHTH